ncbi:gag-pol polyprotein [Trifolium medium]|uniref:Gag-pol polyprotein n=1 Tax=Trifolium medium TaxID=97028 RepID=A0A392Q0H7_9FABA|nr:gag-pol polyprotein [Trifolium medium]
MESASHKRTPAATHLKLTKDEKGIDVDQSLYRIMIGSLLYLTASRPDITFAVSVCARYQVEPKMSHLTRVIVLLIGQGVQMIEKALLKHVSFWATI